MQARSARLRLRLLCPKGTSSAARLIFGGEAYGDSGITLPVGHFGAQKHEDGQSTSKAEDSKVLAGALSPIGLLVFAGLLAGRWRAARPQSLIRRRP